VKFIFDSGVDKDATDRDFDRHLVFAVSALSQRDVFRLVELLGLADELGLNEAVNRLRSGAESKAALIETGKLAERRMASQYSSVFANAEPPAEPEKPAELPKPSAEPEKPVEPEAPKRTRKPREQPAPPAPAGENAVLPVTLLASPPLESEVYQRAAQENLDRGMAADAVIDELVKISAGFTPGTAPDRAAISALVLALVAGKTPPPVEKPVEKPAEKPVEPVKKADEVPPERVKGPSMDASLTKAAAKNETVEEIDEAMLNFGENPGAGAMTRGAAAGKPATSGAATGGELPGAVLDAVRSAKQFNDITKAFDGYKGVGVEKLAEIAVDLAPHALLPNMTKALATNRAEGLSKIAKTLAMMLTRS